MKKIFVILKTITLLALSLNVFAAEPAEPQRQTDSQAKEREYVTGGGMALALPAVGAIRINAQSIEISASTVSASSTSNAVNNSRGASTRTASPSGGKQVLRFNPAPE